MTICDMARRHQLKALSGLIALTLIALLCGCAAKSHTQVTLSSQDNGHVLVQKFSHAYATHDDSGQTDIVLVDNGHASDLQSGTDNPAPGSGPQGSAGGVLLPTKEPPLRQVLHLQ